MGKHYVMGMELGKCYTFRSYLNHRSYLRIQKGRLINSSDNRGYAKWRVVKGKVGRGTISLVNPRSSRYALYHKKNDRVAFGYGRSYSFKRAASYTVGRF